MVQVSLWRLSLRRETLVRLPAVATRSWLPAVTSKAKKLTPFGDTFHKELDRKRDVPSNVSTQDFYYQQIIKNKAGKAYSCERMALKGLKIRRDH